MTGVCTLLSVTDRNNKSLSLPQFWGGLYSKVFSAALILFGLPLRNSTASDRSAFVEASRSTTIVLLALNCPYFTATARRRLSLSTSDTDKPERRVQPPSSSTMYGAIGIVKTGAVLGLTTSSLKYLFKTVNGDRERSSMFSDSVLVISANSKLISFIFNALT